MKMILRKKRLPLNSRYVYFAANMAICFALFPILKAFPSIIKASIVLFILFFSMIDAYRNISYLTICALGTVLNLLIWFGEYQFVSSFSFFDKFAMMCLFWIIIAIGVVLCIRRKWDLIVRLKRSILNCLIVTSLTTILGSFVFEEASRALASGSRLENKIYQLWNIGGYGFIYTLSLAIPWVMYLYNKKKEKKYIIILILFCFCIIRASYATAILLMLFSLVMSCFMNSVRTQKGLVFAFIIFTFLLFIVSFLISDSSFWELLLRLTEGNRTLQFRVQNMHDLILYQNMSGDIAMRGDLYSYSWNSFLQNPILGNVFSSENLPLGYHSEFIDLLGGCGIVGLLILIVLVAFITKSISKVYKNENITRYYALAMTGLTIFGFVNTILGSIEFAILIGFLYLPEYQEKRG